MVYNAENIKRDVRVAIDMNHNDRGLIAIGDIDTLTIDALIESKIEDGVRRILTECSVEYLESGHNFGERLVRDGEGRGHIILPDDFLRLIYFKMSDWSRGVSEAISEQDVQYQYQRSRYRCLRGNSERPVVAIVRRAEGLVLEYYSTKGEDTPISQAVYRPIPRLEGGLIEIEERLYRGCIYMIGGLTMLALNADEGSTLIEQSRSMAV